MNEMLEKRTSHSKTFDLGSGKRKLRVSPHQLHYRTAAGMEEIDLNPVDNGEFFSITKAPFKLKVLKSSPRLEYTSREGKFKIELQLEPMAGVSFVCTVVEGGFVYSGIEDNDIYVAVTRSGFYTEQFVKSPKGQKVLRWKVRQNVSAPIATETQRAGLDALDRNAEVLVKRSPLVKVGSHWEHSFEELVTGKLLFRDATTRKTSASGSVEYPVRGRT